MAEKLKLKKTGNKVRMHVAVLILVIVASIAAGYAASSFIKNPIQVNQNMTITFNSPNTNCIPQADLDFFINQSNQFQDYYKQCVADAWQLKMQYSQQLAKLNNQIAATNSTT